MSGFNKDLKRGEMFFIQKSTDYVECGSEIYSGRPAIIVSNQNLNAVSKTVEVVYLTTKEKYDSKLHVRIQSIKPSVAICEQITTVAKERIGDYYGTCTEEEMRKIDAAMAKSLSLKLEGDSENALSPEEASKLSERAARAEAERDIYKKMYDELLTKALNWKTV